MLKLFKNTAKLTTSQFKYTKNSNINVDYLNNLHVIQKDVKQKSRKEATQNVKEAKKKFNEVKKKETKLENTKSSEKESKSQEEVKQLTRDMLKEAIEAEDNRDKKYEKMNLIEEQRKNFDKHLPFLKQIKYQNVQERDERKAEKRRKFQTSHVVQILNNFYSNDKIMQIDRFIHYYMNNHREISDRKNRQLNKQYTGIKVWEEKFKIFQTLNLESILEDETIPDNVKISCPSYLYDMMVNDYGEEMAFKLAKQMNYEAPTFGRVNPMKITRDELILKLTERGINVYPSEKTKYGLVFTKRHDFRSLDEFLEGYFEIQDESSQLIADLVEAKPGDQVMDYCAGSAGKTLAFAHKLEGKGQIYVCDIREQVLTQAKQRLKRAGIQNAQPMEIGKSTFFEKLTKKVNWLLLDVPCSGSGTLRRNPDAKYKIEKEWMEELLKKQREIFDESIKYLKDGGKIVYATCSILKCENEKQIEYFVKKYNLNVEKSIKHHAENKDSMDGFFAAVLSRK